MFTTACTEPRDTTATPQGHAMLEPKSWRIPGMRKTGPSHTLSIVPDHG